MLLLSFISKCFKISLWFLLLMPGLLWSVLHNFQLFGFLLAIILLSNFKFQHFEMYWDLIMAQFMVYLVDYTMFTWKQYIFFSFGIKNSVCLLDESDQSWCSDILSVTLSLLFKFVLLIPERGMLKCLVIVMEFFVCLFNSVSVLLCIYDFYDFLLNWLFIIIKYFSLSQEILCLEVYFI
jgi:hypothetical protein